MKHTSLLFAMPVALSLVSSPLRGATITKADNADNLNLPSSWEGGVVPGLGDLALWGQTSGTYDTGGDIAFSGISITNFNVGNINIKNNTLTLGEDGLFITYSGTKRQFTLNSTVSLAADQRWSVNCDTFIVNNPVYLNGHTLTFIGGTTKQHKGRFNGEGMLSVEAGNVKFTNTGTTMPDADLVVKNSAKFEMDANVLSYTSAAVFNSISLQDSAEVVVRGGEKANIATTNKTSLTLRRSGTPMLTMYHKSPYVVNFWNSEFLREEHAGVLFVRGNFLGVFDAALQSNNTANIFFDTPPALLGLGGEDGSPTLSILPGIVASTNTGHTVGIGLTTYDAAKGVRLLDFDTEYTPTIVNGENAGNNVRIVNVAEEDSSVKTNIITQNTVINSLSLVTSGTGANGGIVLEAEDDAAYIIDSGVLFTYQAVSSPTSDGSSMVDIHAPIDFNGKQGLLINARTEGAAYANGNGILRLYGPLANDGGNGVVFAGGGVTHLMNTEPHSFTGPLVVNSGTVRFDGTSNMGVPHTVILNGGTIQNRGNKIPDDGIVIVNGGTFWQRAQNLNNGSGASETFSDLTVSGGFYKSGVEGTGSGQTHVSNVVVRGSGRWDITRGHRAYVYNSFEIHNGGSVALTRWESASYPTHFYTYCDIVLDGSGTGVAPVLTFHGGSSSTAHSANMHLGGNIISIGNPNSATPIVIEASEPAANSRLGQIQINGTRSFIVGDGLAYPDLIVQPFLADDVAPGALIKLGAGTLELAATNTYTGGTFVEEGALLLNGGEIACTVDVASGATFGGSGSVGDDVVLGDNATLRFDIQKENPDMLLVNGAITGTGTTLIDVDLTDLEEDRYYLATASSGVTGNFVLPEAFVAKWQISILGRGTQLCATKKLPTLLIVR